MKIRFLTSMAGVDHTRNVGDVVDTPDHEAERLIAAGFAVPVVESSLVENAMASPSAETAMIDTTPTAPKRRTSKKS